MGTSELGNMGPREHIGLTPSLQQCKLDYVKNVSFIYYSGSFHREIRVVVPVDVS